MTEIAEHPAAEFVRRGYMCKPMVSTEHNKFFAETLGVVKNDWTVYVPGAVEELTPWVFPNWTEMTDWLAIGHDIVASEIAASLGSGDNRPLQVME